MKTAEELERENAELRALLVALREAWDAQDVGEFQELMRRVATLT